MHTILKEDIDQILREPLPWEKLKGTHVLITGASGMLGSYITNVLLALNEQKQYGIQVTALVRHPEKLSPEVRDQVQVLCQSVTEPITLKGDSDKGSSKENSFAGHAAERFDYIIHAASPASPLIMKDEPVETAAANVLGAYYTLQAAKDSKAKGYLFISSREIYGQPYEGQEFFTEDTYGFVDPLSPRSCYPEGKKAAENLCMCFQQEYGLNVKIARLAHTLGPGMSIDDGRVQADFLRNVVRHENIVLKSEGKPIRTYTYVADAVSALFYILLKSEDVVYNISSEDATVSIRQLAQTMADAFPERGLKVVFDIPKETKNTGAAPFTLGILKADKLKEIGWKPRHSLTEGIRRTVAYLEGT